MGTSLSTLVDVSESVSYGYTESACLDRVGPRFLRITDIQNGVVDWTTVPFCPIDQQRKAQYQLEEGDIVIARTGNSTGENYLFKGGEDAVFASYLIRFRIDRMKAEPLYVWYNLRSSRWWDFVQSSKTGSAQAGANAKVLGRFEFPLPPLAEQRAIASVLGALDDKIESNRRTSRALEKLARAIFRAWFVDFEPVKAKAAGLSAGASAKAGATTFPGMPQETFDSLPTRFVESELGLIPEGWGVGTLGKVAVLKSERTNPTEETASLPYVPIECISPRQLQLDDWKSGEGAKSSLQFFDTGDILFGAMRAYFHKVSIAPFRGTTRTTVFVLRPASADSEAFLRLLLSEPATIDFATQHSVGSTIPYAKWDNSLASMPVLIPPAQLMSVFADLVAPLLTPLMHFPFENQRLAASRDYVLPKLLSGEVRVGSEVDMADT